MSNAILLVVLASSIWIYFDAKAIGARSGLLSGFADMGPFSWALCSLLLWIVAVPLYLVKRPQIKAAAGGAPVPRAEGVEQTGLNRACKYIALLWTCFCIIGVVFGLASLGDLPIDSSNEYEAAGVAIGASIGLSIWFAAWLFVTLPAAIIFFITRKTVVTLAPPEATNAVLAETRKCPYCAEIIKQEAIVCRFCQKNLQTEPPVIEKKPISPPTPQQPHKDWRSRARQFYKKSEFKEAAMAYSQAIENNPSDQLFYERAATYSKLGDEQKVKADLVAASNLGHLKAKQILAQQAKK